MFAGALLSRAWSNGPYCAVDNQLQKEIERATASESTYQLHYRQADPISTAARTPTADTECTRYSRMPAELVHKTTDVVDKARAVTVHITQEQAVEATYTVAPTRTKTHTQELLRAVSIDYQKHIE